MQNPYKYANIYLTSNLKYKMNKQENNQSRLLRLLQSQLPISNDVFMVFAKNKKFCEEFLRVILQDKKLIVIENDVQKIKL